MSIQAVTQTIQLILAPVVMITACALILSGLLNRFTRINDRMRLLARERFDLLRAARQDAAAASDALFRFRLQDIDMQLPLLVRRHGLLRNSVFLVYCSIAILILDMLVIAVTAAFNHPFLATSTLVVFLLGTGTLLAAIIMAITEVARSYHGLREEVQHIAELPFEEPTE